MPENLQDLFTLPLARDVALSGLVALGLEKSIARQVRLTPHGEVVHGATLELLEALDGFRSQVPARKAR